MKIMINNILQELDDKIYQSSVDDFIAFAKQYNIFQSGGTKFYKETCDKIKDRLQKEGLSIESVRSE